MNSTLETPRPIRVLVTDDSAFMRAALSRMIASHPRLQVCGTAQNGAQALEKVAALQPDVVTLDVEMPGLNGVETLRAMMKESPRPVIMVSSLTQANAEVTLEALDLGAFDYVSKQPAPTSAEIAKIRDELVAKIIAAAESTDRQSRTSVQPKRPNHQALEDVHLRPAVIAVGTSTGGPKALQQILPLLPKDLPVGMLIVQHMPPGFTGPFASRLDKLCQVSVREARHDETVEPGVVYIAPAGQHMTVIRQTPSKVAICLSHSPEDTLHRPSVDVMMLSVARAYRALCLGIILTGMGADGVQGMKAIADAGGLTVGQDEASCTVYGMPRSCAEAGVLRHVTALTQIPDYVLQATRYRKHT